MRGKTWIQGVFLVFSFIVFVTATYGQEDRGLSQKDVKIRNYIRNWVGFQDKDPNYPPPWRKYGKEIIPALRSLLRDPVEFPSHDRSRRMSRILICARELGSNAVELQDAVSEYLKHQDDDVFVSAIDTLASIKATKYLESIVPLLYTSRRTSAIWAIERIGNDYHTIVALKIWNRHYKIRNDQLNDELATKLLEKKYQNAIKIIKERIENEESNKNIYTLYLSDDKDEIKTGIRSVLDSDNPSDLRLVIIPFLFHQDRSIRMESLQVLKSLGERPTKIALQIWYRHAKKEDENRDKKWLDKETKQRYREAIQAIDKRMNENKSSEEK